MELIANWLSSWNVGGKTSIIWFAIFAALIIFCSNKLVLNLDIISKKSSLNASFIGGAFAATITSLPELITEITQSSLGHPEVGMADDIGSNVFSMFLIAVTAIVFIKNRFLNDINGFSRTSFLLSLGAISFLALFLIIGKDLKIGVSGKYQIGIIPMILFFFFIFSLYLGYKYGDDEPQVHELPDKKLKHAILHFILWSTALVIVAILTNVAVRSMSDGFKLEASIAGGLLLAIATSLPEIAVFIALLKIGSNSAAIMSLIGSHLFNIGITFVGDLIYSDSAIITYDKVQENWKLAVMGVAMMLLLSIQVHMPRLFERKKMYFIFPTLISIGYIVGTILIGIF